MKPYKEWRTKEQVLEEFNGCEYGGEILSNDIKEGDCLFLYNCWYAEMLDNARGNIRIANVHGDFTEAGSIYVWDIDKVARNKKMYTVKLTDKQKKDCKETEKFLRSLH